MTGQTRQAIRSLALLSVCGVALSGWTLYYTDWFPVIGGLLGLGGLFAWLAFLANLISDERKAEFQEAFDAHILQERRRVWRVVAVVGLIFVGPIPFWGTLEIESLGEEKSRIVEIRAHDASGAYDGPADARELVSPRGTVKLRVFTGWFGTSRHYVKADGLPGIVVTMPRFGRQTISLPSSFQKRAVVLARPAFNILGILRKTPFNLTVTVNGKPFGSIDNYRGELIWLGAEADVEVPTELAARWNAEVLSNNRLPRGVAAGLSLFKSLRPHQQFDPSSVIRIELHNTNTNVLTYQGALQVPAKGARIQYPLELVISKPVN